MELISSDKQEEKVETKQVTFLKDTKELFLPQCKVKLLVGKVKSKIIMEASVIERPPSPPTDPLLPGILNYQDPHYLGERDRYELRTTLRVANTLLLFGVRDVLEVPPDIPDMESAEFIGYLAALNIVPSGQAERIQHWLTFYVVDLDDQSEEGDTVLLMDALKRLSGIAEKDVGK